MPTAKPMRNPAIQAISAAYVLMLNKARVAIAEPASECEGLGEVPAAGDCGDLSAVFRVYKHQGNSLLFCRCTTANLYSEEPSKYRGAERKMTYHEALILTAGLILMNISLYGAALTALIRIARRQFPRT
jgi:hypothetical protein